jgi:hypothetical protein
MRWPARRWTRQHRPLARPRRILPEEPLSGTSLEYTGTTFPIMAGSRDGSKNAEHFMTGGDFHREGPLACRDVAPWRPYAHLDNPSPI